MLNVQRTAASDLHFTLNPKVQLLTKAWTAGLLNALGDGVAQKFVEKNDSMDLKRLGIFAFLVSTLKTALSSTCYTPETGRIEVWY